MSESFELPPKLMDMHNHLQNDPDGSRLVERMDRNKVQMSVIMSAREVFTSVGTNEHILAAMRKHPGRFVGGVYADPRDGDKAIDTIRRYHDQGMRIVKLLPNFGYYPDDEAFRPFWDAVAGLGMGVLSHCGWLAPLPGVISAAYYSHPGRFEKVIRIYPTIPFILAHFGGIAGYLETVMLTTRTPNTYVDCSPGQGLLVLERGGPMAGAVPPDRMMYGSDSYDLDGLIPRYKDALVAQGYGPHLEKLYYANGRAYLEKIAALQAPSAAGE